MNIHADKTQANENKLVSNAVSQQHKEDESVFQFVDNRPEAIARRKLQEVARNSNQVKQLSAFQEMVNNNPRVKQAAQLQAWANNFTQDQQPVRQNENNTGLPDKLKSGFEGPFGFSMDDVKVHYNAEKPAQLHAYGHMKGKEIHCASGGEQHMPQEPWHVVQLKQGRVKSTPQIGGAVNVNDDKGLKIAGVTGNKTALYEVADKQGETTIRKPSAASTTVQLMITNGRKTFPTTWKGIARTGDQELISTANALWKSLESIIGSGVDRDKLEQAWNKVAKDPKRNFDIVDNGSQLGTEILKKYSRSIQARSQFQSRDNEARTLIRPLMDVDSSFSFASSARNPMVTRDDMEEIEFDPETPRPMRLAT
ncbi:MAG TPA: hypothetical protein VFX43_13470, partial [Chitinophagaceae bacterium]|nr:hypothetical protein [Chitinophagaceae bacterium]